MPYLLFLKKRQNFKFHLQNIGYALRVKHVQGIINAVSVKIVSLVFTFYVLKQYNLHNFDVSIVKVL